MKSVMGVRKDEKQLQQLAELLHKLTVKSRGQNPEALYSQNYPHPGYPVGSARPAHLFIDPTIIFLVLPTPRHHPYGRGARGFM